MTKPLPPVDGIKYNPKKGLLYRPNGKILKAFEMPNGYLNASWCNEKWYYHRLVWKVVTGRDPHPFEVHHRNGDLRDNRIQNLLLVTRSECMIMAHKLRYDNKTGKSGINWCRFKKRFFVQVYLEGTPVYRAYFKSLKRAIRARRKQELIHYNTFCYR